MEQYIGTKIVQAEPVWRIKRPGSELPIYEHRAEGGGAPEIIAPGETVEAGYKVVYEGGYESWSPKDVFEKAYRRTSGMDFGLAIEAAKIGKKIAREGWNGKNQYVVLGTDFQYTCEASDIPGSVAAQHFDIGSKALVFVGTRGSQVGWLASQADMLADDWRIVE